MTNPIVTGESQKGKYNHFVSLSAYKKVLQHWPLARTGGPVEWRGLSSFSWPLSTLQRFVLRCTVSVRAGWLLIGTVRRTCDLRL